MIFTPTELPGVTLIECQPIGDARGSFMRTFCTREMRAHGLGAELAQASQSFNALRGALRGLHFQAHPEMEDKLVRCVRGAIFDVMVDLRIGSPTFGRWVGYELSESNGRQIYAARGFAHGFQTLSADSVVLYHISQFYDAGKARGVRFDDPDIAIRWPLAPQALSPRDLALPRLRDLDRRDLSPYAASTP